MPYEFQRITGVTQVQELAGHACQDVGAEGRIASRLRGAPCQDIVMLRESLLSRVPRHHGSGFRQLRHGAEQTASDIRRMGVA